MDSINGYIKVTGINMVDEERLGVGRLARYMCARDDIETSSDEKGETLYPIGILEKAFAEFLREDGVKQDLRSIVEYAKDTNTTITKAEARMLGKMATAWCKAEGLPLGGEPSEEFGMINTYPTKALEAVFEDFFGEDKAK
jgi:hypothetical protein